MGGGAYSDNNKTPQKNTLNTQDCVANDKREQGVERSKERKIDPQFAQSFSHAKERKCSFEQKKANANKRANLNICAVCKYSRNDIHIKRKKHSASALLLLWFFVFSLLFVVGFSFNKFDDLKIAIQNANVSADTYYDGSYTTTVAFDGSGTQTDPYRIYTASGFAYFRTQFSGSSAYFKLMNDLSISESYYYVSKINSGGYQETNGCNLWTNDMTFNGNFDGNGHTITVNYNDSQTKYKGVFTTVNNATITKLGVSGRNLIDTANGVTLSECKVDSVNLNEMDIGYKYQGGLIKVANGSSNPINIKNCYVTNASLGLDGYMGDVYENIGGICGKTSGEINISNCFAQITVESDFDGDGLSGYNAGISGGNEGTITITNCFAVISDESQQHQSYKCGIAPSTATINNCYYTYSGSFSVATNTGTSLLGLVDSVKDTSKFTTENIKNSNGNSYAWSTNTDCAWDLINIWKIQTSGYPELKAFLTIPSASVTISTNNGTYNGNTTDLTISNSASVWSCELPSADKFSRMGYDFAGYEITNNVGSVSLTGNKYVYAFGDTNGTLQVVWTAIEYSITYTLDGGNLSGQKTKYTIEMSYTLPIPTRDGFNFAGWTGSNGETPQESVTISQGSTGNKNYVANWVGKNFTINLTCTNFTNQQFMIFILRGDNVVKQIVATKATISLELDNYSNYSSNKYTVAFVFGYYGAFDVPTANNSSVQDKITITGRKIVIDSAETMSINYTIATPRINSTVCI